MRRFFVGGGLETQQLGGCRNAQMLKPTVDTKHLHDLIIRISTIPQGLSCLESWIFSFNRMYDLGDQACLERKSQNTRSLAYV